MISPAFIIMMSPIFKSSEFIFISFSSFNIVISGGTRFFKRSIAADVFDLAFSSSAFPIVINASIMAAESKYKLFTHWFINSWFPLAVAINIIFTSPYTKDIDDPIEISVSMFGARWIAPFVPFIKNFLFTIRTGVARSA